MDHYSFINQAFWDALPEGYVTIRFYASDSAGNIGFTDITVYKQLISEVDDDDDDDDEKFFSIIIIILIAEIISISIIGTRKMKPERRREEAEKKEKYLIKWKILTLIVCIILLMTIGIYVWILLRV